MSEIIKVSSLGKTWVLDLDGTVLRHNGYKLDGYDTLLPGAMDFFNHLSPKDMVIFVTSRTEVYREQTEKFLQENGIQYKAILFGAPYGERILINDKKPSGLDTALAINTIRDKFCTTQFVVDELL